jgi:hypothetical protein
MASWTPCVEERRGLEGDARRKWEERLRREDERRRY